MGESVQLGGCRFAERAAQHVATCDPATPILLRPVCSGRVARVDFFRSLFLALGRHFGGIGRAGNAARTRQLALNVVFGVVGFATVWLAGLEPSILEHS